MDLPLLGLRAPEPFDLRRGRQAQKARYGGELIPVDRSDQFGDSILDIFQRDKATGGAKGIVVIALGDLP